ncbi:MAG: L-threonylcarbamoyladenylate synthase [Verrucomicrobiota bacterium]|nr:L-threonylcarbamoyladenylate synthase [Verrucomicrobiota bacterium]
MDKSGAKVMPTDTPELMAQAVREAVTFLRAGELVAVPTETVYGLAANALDQRAVARIFEVKNRPPRNPIIVHVASIRMAQECVAAWPRTADLLAKAFWPGPLTLVLQKAKCIPEIVTAGGDTVGVRWPDHPVIDAVINACGFPLAAPSANVSSQLSATTAQHVQRNLGEKLQLILDGGPCPIGIESTVLDLTCDPPRVLRPGLIHESAISAVLGRTVATAQAGKHDEPLRSPGQMLRHYAPRARLFVWRGDDEKTLQILLAKHNLAAVSCHLITHVRPPTQIKFGNVMVLPRDVRAYARVLYAALHECDEACASAIIVRAPPESPEWSAIADRLARASAGEGHS